MLNDKKILYAIAAAFILVLGLLFGMTGIIIGVLITITTASVFCVLTQLGAQEDFAFAFSIPAGLVILSSLTYLLGFILGIKASAIVTTVLMLGIMLASPKILKTLRQKLNKSA